MIVNSPLMQIDLEIAKRTADILSSDGFVKDPARDLNYGLKTDQTVSQVQGSIAFCKKVVHHTTQTPSVLSPHYLRSQRHINEKNYQILRCKRLGHVLNLGYITGIKNHSIHLEGFSETFTVPMLTDMWDQFALTRKDLVTQKLYDQVRTPLIHILSHDNADEAMMERTYQCIHAKGFHTVPALVSSGWVWHSTEMIFYRNCEGTFLFYGNRGDDCEDKPGIMILKIAQQDKITREFLKRVISRLSVDYDQYTNLEKIKKELDAHVVGHISMRVQKVGNCTYSSAKAGIFALVLIALSGNNTNTNLIISGRKRLSFMHPDTVIKGREIYKAFTRFDKEAILKDFLLDIKESNSEKNCSIDRELGSFVSEWVVNHFGKDQIDPELLKEASRLIASSLAPK
jgi:hypothetical protein